MQPIEIIVIIASVAIVTLVFGRLIYKKIKGLPTDSECESCKKKVNVNKMLKEIRAELDEELCHCQK